MARLHLRPGLVLAAVAGALCLPVTAQAAWAPPQPVDGPAGMLGLVSGGEAGRVAVGGPQIAGPLFAAAHPPGGVFGASVLAGAGTEDFPAVIGRGGAIAAADGGRPTIRRLRPDGSVSAPVDVGGVDDTIVGRPAVAPSGALLVVVTDENGDAQLWRQPGDGQPASPLAFNLPDAASVADIAAIGDDQFVVGLSAPNVGDAPGVRVRTIVVTGTAAVAGAPAETTAGAGDSVGELQVVPGPQPAVVYTLGTSSGIAVKLAAPTPQPLATADGDTTTLDTPRAVAVDAGYAVAWTLVAGGGVSTTGFAVLPSPGAPGCRGSVGFEQSDVVNRGGPVLVGLRADGAVGLAATGASCAVGTPDFSAAVADAGDLTAAVDADGTVLGLVGRGEAGASAVVPNDVTPPLLGDPSVPATVRSGSPFPASIAASDPWGVSRVAWAVDGAEVAEGTSVTIPGLPAGRHRIVVTGTNAAGLTATRGADVVASDDAPAPTPTPTPTATPAPTVTPPAAAEDDVAPVISRVRLHHELFRPRAARVLPRGSAVRFRLSENARTRMTIQRGGIRRGMKRSRCDGVGMKPTRDRRGLMLAVTRNLKAGANAFALAGRGPKGNRLPRGRFRVSLQARDAAGNRSVTRFIRFTLC